MPKRRAIGPPRGAQTPCAHARQRVAERLGGERVQECATCGATLSIIQRAWRVISDAELIAEAERRKQRLNP